MKRSLLIILILVGSLLLVSCTTETPTEDTDDMNIMEEDTEDPADEEEIEIDVEEEIEENPDMADGFAYSVDNIREFELDIELLNGDEIDYSLDDDNETVELLENVEITLDRPLKEMMDDVLAYLDISRDEIDEFELELEFTNSKEIDFKYDREENAEDRNVKEFDLEIEFTDGSEWNFEYELNEDYEIEGRENLEGEEARNRIEDLISALDISMDSSIREIQDSLFNHLDIDLDQVDQFDLDIEYVDGAEIDVKVHY